MPSGCADTPAPAGAAGILRRLLMMVRHFFPGVRIRIRLDGGFTHPALLDFLDAEPNLEYVVAMAKNAVLQRKAEEAMQYARVLSGVTGQTEHVYADTNYAAGSWERERRILIKAEVVYGEGKEPRDNPRFVLTNMTQTPQWLYEQIDRTSCSNFWANQFRVLLTAAAYVLMQELRLSAAGTNCARAQAWTLRERFLKLGAQVVASVRRIVLHLPQSFPFLAAFRHMAMELGASPGSVSYTHLRAHETGRNLVCRLLLEK